MAEQVVVEVSQDALMQDRDVAADRADFGAVTTHPADVCDIVRRT
ncbi:hypothetical protein [Amnibacterium kyonggiense]|nr:hypothetical protein [Amnibacterium kyonggiense]